MKKVLVGMSGGVDSAMSAYLLKENGYDISGANCRFFSENDEYLEKSCCSLEDIKDAKSVAERLSAPFYVFDFSKEFKSYVIKNFVDTYINGATPNPCIVCNKHLKFGEMLKKAKELGFDYIATGHYAIIEYSREKDRYILKKAKDLSKDQTYVLYSLTQEQLQHILFPLGNMLKTEVRAIAEEKGFVNAKKHDSQDICFIPDGDYASFIERFSSRTFPSGNFVDEQGKVVGTHKGIIKYTIGQRRGLEVALGRPVYVKSKNLETNTVTLCDNENLFTNELFADNLNFISVATISEPMRVKAKIRYNHAEQWATATLTESGLLHVVFDEKQRAIAKGQAVVLYDGDEVVGGGTIL